MINLDKVSEGIHYVLHKMDGVDNSQAWEVEFREGKYKGTICAFGNVKFDGVNNKLAFTLAVRQTPISNLSAEDPEFKDYAGIILEDLIKTNLASGTLIYGQNENN